MKALLYYLNSRSPQDLRVISEAWEANVSERLMGGNAFELAQEMQSEFLQRRVFSLLSDSQLKLLQRLLENPDKTEHEFNFTRRHLQELENSEPKIENFQEALKELQKKGLLFEEQITTTDDDPDGVPYQPKEPTRGGWATIYSGRRSKLPELPKVKPLNIIPRELALSFLRFFAERAQSKSENLPLKDLLRKLDPAQLEAQAANWGVLTLLGTASHGQLVEELSKVLNDSQQQKTFLKGLPAESRELFDSLKRAGRPTIPALLKNYVSYRRLGRALRPLVESLLVWMTFEGEIIVVFVPPEVARPVAPAKLSSTPLQTVAPPSDATRYPPYAFAWDLLSLLNYLQQNNVELTSKGVIAKRDIKKMLGLLWLPEDDEPVRLDFLLRLGGRLKLVHTEVYSSRVETGAGLEDWLKLDFYEQMRRLVELWLEDGGRFGPVAYPYYYSSSKLITEVNNKILKWIAEGEPGEWFSFEDFLQKIRRENPYFIVSRTEMVRTMGLQQVAEHDKRWQDYEGEILYRTFDRPLEWLGIIKTSRNERGRIVAYSLTDWGAEVCKRPGAVRQSVVTVEKPLLVQPNFEVMLFAPHVETLWTLQKIANIKQLDQVSLYTLTKDSILRALESGLKLNELTDWLESRSAQPLPQNLVISLRDWSKGFRRVGVDNVTLLEVESPEILDELMNNKQFSSYFVRKVSPTAAIVKLPDTATNRRTDPLKTFKSKLKTAGFFADIS